MQEITVDEYKLLQRMKRIRAVMSRAEEKAGEYLTITRKCRSGGPVLWFEPYKLFLGGTTYKPDWVVYRNEFDQEIYEVKEVKGKAWKGFRDRESRVKLEFLKYIATDFGWRCYWLLVEGSKVTEKEI